MRLASETEIVIGHDTITLRPTLRAAHLLDQKYGGFERLLHAVLEGSLTALSDVITRGCGQSTALTRYLASAEGQPLAVSVAQLTPQIVSFIYELAGVDPSQNVKPGKPIPFVEYHTELFRIATGWLGWTPQQTWDATPAEIIEAQRGRIDMLGAIFGKGDDSEGDNGSSSLADASTRDRLNALGTLSITNMRDVP